jgi:membrane-bound inhibitor of C-type lysozyme
MNRSCLTGLLCSLPTICVAADVVIRLPQAPSVMRNVVTYVCEGLPQIRVEYITEPHRVFRRLVGLDFTRPSA